MSGQENSRAQEQQWQRHDTSYKTNKKRMKRKMQQLKWCQVRLKRLVRKSQCLIQRNHASSESNSKRPQDCQNSTLAKLQQSEHNDDSSPIQCGLPATRDWCPWHVQSQLQQCCRWASCQLWWLHLFKQQHWERSEDSIKIPAARSEWVFQ